jgi:hypothetical protein
MSKDLRTQFIDYMTLQRFSPHTKRGYLSAVQGLTKYHDQSPDTLTNDQVQEYFRYLLEERKLSWGSCNSYFRGNTGRHIGRTSGSSPARTRNGI